MANEARNTRTRAAQQIVGALKSLSAQQTTGGGTPFTLGAAYQSFGIELFRGTTSSTNESTSASVRLQGQIGTTGTWHNLGAAITVNSATPSITRSTNHIPVTRVRLQVVSFTTSAGNSTAGGENKIPITGYISVGSLSS